MKLKTRKVEQVEQVQGIPVGTEVMVVNDQLGYIAFGELRGLAMDVGISKVRVLGSDGLERHVPTPVTVTQL